MKKVLAILIISFLLLFAYSQNLAPEKKGILGSLTSTLSNVISENTDKEKSDKVRITEKELKNQQSNPEEVTSQILEDFSSSTTLTNFKNRINEELNSIPDRAESSYNGIKEKAVDEITVKEKEVRKYIKNIPEELSQKARRELCREICGEDCSK